jgi:putative membrane protein
MKPLARRAVLTAGAAVACAMLAGTAHAVDPLPDARFVGFAQAVNDFEIASGRLALARSANENVRGLATRTMAEFTDAAERLVKSRSEAGVSYAPDPAHLPNGVAMLQRLNALQGPEFDAAYANAQLAILTEADLQYGAFSQSGQGGPLRRYAQQTLPKIKVQLEFARRLAGGR